MSPTKAKGGFWLDGGYDFELVQECRFHPAHNWFTLCVGDVKLYAYNPDERLTVCSSCGVPRCGSTIDPDRCTLWRHHESEHVFESGKREAVGGPGMKAW